ncbi:MAG: hypothetical protein J7L11_01250 [Thermoprotei archaeon]|nr:hypothetical protein [Thermoprotei archaeon]
MIQTEHRKVDMVIKRLEAFWNDEITYIPVVIRVNPKLNVSYKEYLLSNEAQLKHQLHSVSLSLRVGSDYVPNLWPYMGTGVYASAFGCEIIFPDNTDPWTKPVIKTPEDVYSLEYSLEKGLLPLVLRRIKFFLRETKGEIPIRLTDTQDPIDTAALMWSQGGLIKAMLTNPKEVHYLLGRITELIIEFSKKFRWS